VSPIRNERTVIPHPSLRVKWGWGCVIAFVLVCSASAFGGAFFPLALVLLIAWMLWRGDRDGGRN
jgi:hypothetical protein